MSKNKCGYCRRKFTRKRNLATHTRTQHHHVTVLEWQVHDIDPAQGMAKKRDLVRFRAAVQAHRASFVEPKGQNRSFFNKYASWLTDAPQNYKVRLRYTHEHDQRKLNLQDNSITYACMFAQAHQMSTNQFKFMHASRVKQINDCWKHFV